MFLQFRAILALAVTVGLLGCAGWQRPAPEEPRGTVRFKGEPKDALLSVNEIHLGPIQMFEEKGVRLRPGAQRIVVSKEGFFTEYRMVDVKEDTITTVEIVLREIP
jgi:hypothetical protein